MTRVIHGIAELRAALADGSGSVALVPTMGALHEGHLSLMRLAHEHAERVVASVFVNPLQFGPGEDFERYPRTLDADVGLLSAEGVELVFAPDAAEMYPDGRSQTSVRAGRIAESFEGAARPGHFDGMLTVVLKLFSIVQPDVAVFGQKDAQQFALIRQMVTDFNLPLDLVAGSIWREADGLACSSRNRYLSLDERAAAACIPRALDAAEAASGSGADAVLGAAARMLASEPLLTVEYLALVDPLTFVPIATDFTGDSLLITAVRLGRTRLLDNRTLVLKAKPSGSLLLDT